MDKRVGYKRQHNTKLNEFYCFLHNNFSSELYPSNKAYNFINELQEPVTLIGSWKVSLSEYYLEYSSPPASPVYLLCAICNESPSRISNYHQNSILRSIILPQNDTSSQAIYQTPYYFPIGVSVVERIPIEVVKTDGTYLDTSSTCHVTLHFRRDEQI